ncbi:MAG: mycothiol system anti-sigma-R factor [Fimbriimonadaceae bacterium]|nr:mycothiol system anti-sigma-R factor [Fimbriimonadaceae bacterium]
MSERMLSCEEVLAFLMPYLDRELDSEESALVQHHLDACGHCASLFSFEQSMLKLVKDKLNEESIPEDLRSRIFSSLNEA